MRVFCFLIVINTHCTKFDFTLDSFHGIYIMSWKSDFWTGLFTKKICQSEIETRCIDSTYIGTTFNFYHILYLKTCWNRLEEGILESGRTLVKHRMCWRNGNVRTHNMQILEMHLWSSVLCTIVKEDYDLLSAKLLFHLQYFSIQMVIVDGSKTSDCF